METKLQPMLCGFKDNPSAGQLNLKLNIAGNPFLKPGESNKIIVRAFNEEGYLESRGAEIEYIAPKTRELQAQNLYAVIVGISHYEGDMNLRYAAKDAADFADALKVGANRLFGSDRVHINLLTTDTTEAILMPSKSNIIAALKSKQTAKPEDVLVIYLAGHSVNWGGAEGDLYYLTAEARTGILTDPAIRGSTSISSEEITNLLLKIPALKKVVILDVCGAGRFIEQFAAKRDVPSSQIRALERMKDRTGLFVLAGCAADASSYEASRYGQGLLTYSLLMAMKGAKLRDNMFVDVNKLFDFATDEVPVLASGIGGIQKPIEATPYGGQSFDIGEITDQERPEVPLATAKPIILQASFQDEIKFRDYLNLSKKVDDALREISARGSNATMIFVDADQFPDAYSISGSRKLRTVL